MLDVYFIKLSKKIKIKFIKRTQFSFIRKYCILQCTKKLLLVPISVTQD